MTVAELIEKLQVLPEHLELKWKEVGKEGKIVMIAEGHELDPICQFKPRLHQASA
jgi:hypothetical protein